MCCGYGYLDFHSHFNGRSLDDRMHIEESFIDPLYLKMIEGYPDLEIAVLPMDGSRHIKTFYFKSSNGINVVIVGAG